LVFFIPQPPELMQRLRERLARAFAGAGLDLEAHARFLPWQNRAAFYGLMQEADVYLDTLGFSGYNTAMQAIENALPVVAYEGRFLRGRLTSGILRHMGLDEQVAGAEADYVQAVVKLAQDAAHWGEVRGRMIAARAGLYDDAAPVRALEGFFEDALRK
jgi:predicted O-linked N-acetylglucosamine transferase (SPINDLY family)